MVQAIWLGRVKYFEKIFKPSPGNYNRHMSPNEGLSMLDMDSKGIIFNREHNSWNSNRKYFTRAISSPVFLRQSVGHVHSLFLEMGKYWKDLERRNIEIDVANWMLRFFAEALFLII